MAALHNQLLELTAMLEQLETARATYLPPAPQEWFGAARALYDSAFDGLVNAVDIGIIALRAARDHTGSGLAEMRAHA